MSIGQGLFANIIKVLPQVGGIHSLIPLSEKNIFDLRPS